MHFKDAQIYTCSVLQVRTWLITYVKTVPGFVNIAELNRWGFEQLNSAQNWIQKKTHKNVFSLSIIFPHWWRVCMKLFFKESRSPFIPHCLCHWCWSPVDPRSLGISSHRIGLCCLKYSSLSSRTLIPCVQCVHDWAEMNLLRTCSHAQVLQSWLGLRPANERRRYKVTPSLIGWAQT